MARAQLAPWPPGAFAPRCAVGHSVGGVRGAGRRPGHVRVHSERRRLS